MLQNHVAVIGTFLLTQAVYQMSELWCKWPLGSYIQCTLKHCHSGKFSVILGEHTYEQVCHLGRALLHKQKKCILENNYGDG